MKIFDIKKLFRVVAVVAVCMMSFGAHAAYYDDDDYDECPYFTPAYALCTTHAYNAAMGKNPTDSSQIAKMNEIIALKSTVIAQQMKQQYDVLNAMVKRFKTQLEKSVLKSKIEVMTGGSSSSSSSSSGGSSSKGGGIASAEDCDILDKANIYDCLLRNLNKIEKAAEKDIGNARKQLQNDMEIAIGYKMCTVKEDVCDGCGNISTRPGVINCIKMMRRGINDAKSTYEDTRAKNRNPWG